MNLPDTTIVAQSTPPGRGGIAVIRLSGPEALACAREIFRMRSNGRIDPGRAILGTLGRGAGRKGLDSGYLTYHPRGGSYTGEDVVELSCHGSPVVVEQLIRELLAAGAVPAAPGEFTYRAVLNGKLDLAQAEGVRDLIDASTPAAARAAREQIRGNLSRRLASMKDQLVDIICDAEASLEFGDSEDEVFPGNEEVAGRLGEIALKVEAFVASYRQGKLLREGAEVILAGRPNVGKSSLFNYLLQFDRAIVSDEPGTTRDFITERIDLGGIPVSLNDTAGLRSAPGGIEGAGIRHARQRIEQADLVLLLCPCDESPGEEERELMQSDRTLLVASKTDRVAGASNGWTDGAIKISVRTGEGIDRLREAIFRKLASAPSLSIEEALITDARHHEALRSCAAGLASARRSIETKAPDEITLVDLHAALSHLGEITGAVRIEQIHERIFSSFCIGK